MSTVAVVWLVVGICTLLVLAAFMVQLVKQVKRLTGSVVRFQREVQPVLEGIQRDAQAAQERSERVQEQVEAIRRAREGGSTRARARHRR
jgi:predicted PurR-regulated permease PerM